MFAAAAATPTAADTTHKQANPQPPKKPGGLLGSGSATAVPSKILPVPPPKNILECFIVFVPSAYLG